MKEIDITKVCEFLSEPRLSPYYADSESNNDALELYVWTHRIASACFELIAHLEVGVRNSIDSTLQSHYEQRLGDIPWLFQAPLINAKMAESISTARQRLSEAHKNNRHQICSSLSFGFWSGLLGKYHDELWKKCLHKAFPYAYEGRRKSVSVELEAIRKFRNRIAHHNSLLRTDILFEVARIFKLAGYIDPDFEKWIRSVSRVNDVYREKPTQEIDTVVVAAKEAWPLYQEASVYVCQPGRSFRDTKYIAFYHDRKIEPEFARIKAKFDDVIWTEENAEKLSKSSDRIEKKIGHAIRESRLRGWTGGRYQIFILSSPGEKYPHGAHRSRETPIPHQHNGRGSAFTMGQKYTSLHKLETAETTDDL